MAVHPEDDRYKKFHGRTLVHPFSDRKVPVILDPVLVDMEFGTGAVKVGSSNANVFRTRYTVVVRYWCAYCIGRDGKCLALLGFAAE